MGEPIKKPDASSSPEDHLRAESKSPVIAQVVTNSSAEVASDFVDVPPANSETEILTAEIVVVDSPVESAANELIRRKIVGSGIAEVSNSMEPLDVSTEHPIAITASIAEPPVVQPPQLVTSDVSFGLPDSDAPQSTAPLDLDDDARPHSWIFRASAATGLLVSRLFGIASVIFLLAFAANIPIVQFLSFGYLLEVSGRLARKQRLRDAMIGLKKASVLGGIVLGTWLTLIPVRFVSGFWYDAYLIDPSSQQTQNLRTLQTVMIVLVVIHIGSVWACGGKLRYFFWPVIAPFSFGIWLSRRLAGGKLFRTILSYTVGLASPALVNDICNAQPISDWFVPALFWKRIRTGKFYQLSRDGVWDFATQLNLPYYFQLGLKGFVGTFLWLFLPTSLLVVASYTEDGAAILSGLFGVILAIPIFMLLPFMQAHFATDGKLKRFVELPAVFGNFGRAPLAHLLALLLTLVLALPLFFLKIEEIPSELLWTLSVVFVVFSWPARVCVGWAYGRGAKRHLVRRWWIRYPVLLCGIPIALAFALILTLTRYVSWHGALSLFENHVFLLPAPFWL